MMKLTFIICMLIISMASHATTIDTIRGASRICVGNVDTLRDSTTGGIWTSSDTIKALIDTSGVLHGIAAGVTTITYTVDTSYVVKIVTVDAPPHAGTISGRDWLCPWGDYYVDTIPGGKWFVSDTAAATIDSTGFARAHFFGLHDTILYVVSNSCGRDTARFPVVTDVCEGAVHGVNSPAASIQLFPNPVLNELTISSDEKINRISVFSALGTKLFDQDGDRNSISIDVADFPAGIYFVKINGGEVRKFIKE